MDYLPKYQPSPYMLQRMPRQQGLLGSEAPMAQLDQGLLSQGETAFSPSPQQQYQPTGETGMSRMFNPVREAVGGYMQPVRDGSQQIQQQYNSFVQPVEDKLNSLFPQQPMSGSPASGGGDERQQMLMNFLKSMFGGK